jgi:hypothetical protein
MLKRLSTRSMIAATVVAATACGPAAPAEVAPAPAAVGPAARPTPKSRLDELANAKVYDARGAASPCAPPQPTCPEADGDRAFQDRCRLAGFQVRQCGCARLCSGDAAAALRHYDAAGNPADCAPSRADCTPPQAPAAFQDACAEKGYRLDTCGCAWLCSGNPTSPRK